MLLDAEFRESGMDKREVALEVETRLGEEAAWPAGRDDLEGNFGSDLLWSGLFDVAGRESRTPVAGGLGKAKAGGEGNAKDAGDAVATERRQDFAFRRVDVDFECESFFGNVFSTGGGGVNVDKRKVCKCDKVGKRVDTDLYISCNKDQQLQ